MDKKIALISSYCDTEEKISILKENCRILKNLGIDTFVISPLPIEIESDFLFVTKENPILKWPDRMYSVWREFQYMGKDLRIQTHIDDYGWASLYQIKKILEISSLLDYNFYYLLIYDLDITAEIIKEIQEEKINISYPRIDKNSGSVHEYSFHFSIFDKDNLVKVQKKINLNDYLNFNGFAESFISKWMRDLDIPSSGLIVSDKIFLHEGKDYFNYSKSDFYKVYFGKTEGTTKIYTKNSEGILENTLKIFLYEIKTPLEITINGEKILIKENSDYLLERNISCFDVFQIEIKDRNPHHIDYMNTYKNITKNLIYFL